MTPRAILWRLFPTLLLLAILEAGMRVTGWPSFDACWIPRHELWVQDPELGYGFAPGSVTGGRTEAVVNELGLRGPVLPVAKPDGHYRILYVGDSTCWGLKVPLEESFAHRATERIGADHPGTVFEYMIGAVPGYSSYHSTVMVKRLLPRKPDLVVFYVGARND